jgi:rhodanese-related sulfurtransferase
MAMNAPFYKFDMFGEEASLIVAFIIGVGFGFALERAGFGSARKLAAQFYFKDLSVLKVMFTAIITAMVGLYLLSGVGVVDLSLVYLTPTFLVPQIVGGIILGVGFVIGGYCPGTSVVSAGTGRIDGMTYLVGVCVGLFVFAEGFPLIDQWTKITPMGQTTMAGFFGIPYGLLVIAVVLMAIVAFVASEWAEKQFGGKSASPDSLIGPGKPLRFSRVLMASVFVVAILASFMGHPYKGHKVTLDTKELALAVGSETDHIKASELADKIIAGDMDYLLIDLRSAEDYARYHIPSAINMPLASLDLTELPRNTKILLYSEGGIHASQAWFLFKANQFPWVYQLKEGLNAWMDEVVYPSKPMGEDPQQLAEFAKRIEVAKFFGGKAKDADETKSSDEILAPPTAPIAPIQPIQASGKPKRREGC